MENKKLLWELGIIAILVFWFFFVQTNAVEALGTVYIGLALGAGLIAFADYQFGKKEIFLVNENYSLVTSAAIGVVGYFIVIFAGQLIVRLLTGIPITNALQLLQATAPAFSNSVIINNITFGVMIPYVETYAIFVVFYDLLSSMVGVDINWRNLKNWKLIGVIIFLTILFLFLHITSKGITNQASLVIVGFMALVSLLIVTITREARSAIILHVVANSTSLLLGGG